MGKLSVKKTPSRSAQIGDMRHKVSIYRRSIREPDFESASFGQEHTLIASLWAAISTVSAAYTFDGVDTDVTITHKFAIRNREDIQANDIIKYKGKSYKIVLIDDGDLRERFLFFFCERLGDSDLDANR